MFTNPDMDAVLVSATSFDELNAAYPNYFTDISKFVDVANSIVLEKETNLARYRKNAYLSQIQLYQNQSIPKPIYTQINLFLNQFISK